jgi:pentapeptide MXKDX repeat protein
MTMTRLMSAAAVSFALASAGFGAGMARAADPMQADPMASCMATAAMQTDPMKKSEMTEKCKHHDAMKPDAMQAVPKQ